MTTTYRATPPGDLTLPTGSNALDDTYRAITWRLIPFLFVLWVLAWIDRVNIGFVKLTMLNPQVPNAASGSCNDAATCGADPNDNSNVAAHCGPGKDNGFGGCQFTDMTEIAVYGRPS